MKIIFLARCLMVAFGLLTISGILRGAETGPLLRFMSWETPIADLFLVVGKELKPLSIPAYNVSGAVALPEGTVDVQLVKKTTTPEGRETTVVVAQGSLPEKAEGALVVLIPPAQPAGGSRHRLLIYPDSPTEFPAKSLRLINLSGDNSVVRVAGEDHAIPFGQGKVTPLVLDRLGRCLVTAAVLDAGKWIVVYKDLMAPGPTQRATLLMVYSPTGAGTTMTYDEILAGGKHVSTQFAIVLFDDVIGGKLQRRPELDANNKGGLVTPDRNNMAP